MLVVEKSQISIDLQDSRSGVLENEVLILEKHHLAHRPSKLNEYAGCFVYTHRELGSVDGLSAGSC